VGKRFYIRICEYSLTLPCSFRPVNVEGDAHGGVLKVKVAGLMLQKLYPSTVRRPSCYSPKETMKLIDGIPIWGTPDEGAVSQIKTCAKTADRVALMADHHKGYAVPIGGVVAYKDAISPSGVGFDIACGRLLTKHLVWPRMTRRSCGPSSDVILLPLSVTNRLAHCWSSKPSGICGCLIAMACSSYKLS
jgi:hypothetical protein